MAGSNTSGHTDSSNKYGRFFYEAAVLFFPTFRMLLAGFFDLISPLNDYFTKMNHKVYDDFVNVI